ncbi:MAG: sensor histidine kinase N-terminal domain-containing protein [Burkholderiales bacterium]|nr:sensor histidine kinase N-terminal domain-containing protein [Burkholderiales bacterium]
MTSIRLRLTRSLVLTLFAVFLAGLLALYYAVRGEFIESFDHALATEARAISTLVTAREDGVVTLAFSDKFLRGFDDDVASDFYQLWDADGRTLARSESLEDKPDLPMKSGSMKKPKHFFLVLPDGKPGRGIGVTFEPRPAIKGTKVQVRPLTLVVAAHSAELDEELRELLVGTGAWAAALLLAVGLLVPWLLHRGLKPLERLAGAVAAVDASTLDTRFATAGLPRELAPITTTLNALLARLEESFERERRVSSAMAHELRTPIAVLRSSLDNLKLKGLPADSAVYVDRAEDGLRRLDTVLTRMAEATRLEQTVRDSERERYDAAEVLAGCVAGYAAAYPDVRFELQRPAGPVMLNGAPQLFAQMLDKLAANAADFAEPGTPVRMALAMRGTTAVLTVANRGPRLPAGLQLFESMQSAREARAPDIHLGLGLYIVRLVAEFHRGRAAAADLPDGSGVQFTVELPTLVVD